MFDVVRFALRFQNPHGDRRISKVCLVEMKDNFFSCDIQNLLHDVPLSCFLFIRMRFSKGLRLVQSNNR